MSKNPDDRRLELLPGTLDMLILRTLQRGRNGEEMAAFRLALAGR